MLDPDVWGTVADWLVALTAIGGVGFGIVQLRSIRKADQDTAAAQEATAKAHRDWVQVQRAQFLVRLDDRFESEAMGQSRRSHRALRNRFEQEANTAHPDRSNAVRASEAARLFSAHLTEVWRQTRTLDAGTDPTAADPTRIKAQRAIR